MNNDQQFIEKCKLAKIQPTVIKTHSSTHFYARDLTGFFVEKVRTVASSPVVRHYYCTDELPDSKKKLTLTIERRVVYKNFLSYIGTFIGGNNKELFEVIAMLHDSVTNEPLVYEKEKFIYIREAENITEIENTDFPRERVWELAEVHIMELYNTNCTETEVKSLLDCFNEKVRIVAAGYDDYYKTYSLSKPDLPRFALAVSRKPTGRRDADYNNKDNRYLYTGVFTNSGDENKRFEIEALLFNRMTGEALY